MLYEQRQQALRKKWGFECACEMCSASRHHIAESDRRRARIQTIRSDVIGIVRKGQFQRAIDLNKELLELVEQEQLVDHVSDTYEILAKLYNAVRDSRSAERYARLALADLKVFGGPDRYDSVQKWQDLL